LGRKKIKTESIKSNNFKKNLLSGIYATSLYTPPELKKIKNSEQSFLMILYSGKYRLNSSSSANKSLAIAVLAAQGLLDLKIFFLLLKIFTLVDQGSSSKTNVKNL